MSQRRCFGHAATPKVTEGKNAERLTRWIAQQAKSPLVFTEAQQQHLARLLPLLLCGEQSAQLVFNQEIERLGQQQPSLTDKERLRTIATLQAVEADECRHDIALQQVADSLPQHNDAASEIAKVQRLAKRFYMGLGRVENYQQHFVRIATLDTCVTQIMHSFEHSNLGREHGFSQLCAMIKKDEAKHVYVSRHHAIGLGASADDFAQQQESVSSDLFTLLLTQQRSFESMGVCLDSIKQRLEDKWQ
ncbi:hypothetical protein G3R49_12770 [Shewanella sp. WXL01]|uniref:Uncharacterized protein n=1 Tax=Shewanella maritima TaxID=2520507 RepID=A0A411PJE2_9GAMM|nr:MULTISPECIES: hypothetical protein [Shewanella]NKF51431.1 hypothetical protein [Shewanella sp. WXL01]QBF83679.1 hypothetical protein EXU30_13985 [Shewanella maritima]